MSPDAAALLRQASALRNAGRTGEAADCYCRLLALEPGLCDSWYNLGFCLRQQGRFDEALAAYAEALARGVSGPEEVHLNRAVILGDHLHRPDAARAELEAALVLRPDYVPALLNLGNLREDLGERAAAAQAYDRALAAEPGNILALVRRAGLAAPTSPADPAIAALASALGRPALDDSERADIGFALARLLDLAGAFADAFAAAAAANRASARASGARYDPVGAQALIDRIIAAFPAPVPAPAGEREDPAAPLFICGMFRSGSTLVEQILSRHPAVLAGGEIDRIGRIAASAHPFPERVAEASPAEIAQWRAAYSRALPALTPGARLVTDKMPDNFLFVGLIKRLFPAARIVFTRRQPLDNILSLFFLHLDAGRSYALDLADAAHWYRQHDRLLAHWRALYPATTHVVDYDRLVADPAPVVADLLAFAGLEWDGRCLAPEQAERAVRTASVWQVREPLYRRSSGRWRHYEAQLAPIAGAFAR